MARLEHKTAVITGASSGIGRGIALKFASEGANVIINYRKSKQQAEEIVREISLSGGSAVAIQADISQRLDIEKLIKDVSTRSGKIDIWVNNAGADILTGDGAEYDDETKLQQLIAIDLIGTMQCCWSLVPVMKKQGGGVIINMSWDLALHGFHGHNPQIFAAVKSGILGFSRSFAKSYGPEIRVNILAPGWIETAFAKEVMEKEYYQERLKEIPVGRFGTPEDVAEAALFLASDESSYMTGEMIKINGGLS